MHASVVSEFTENLLLCEFYCLKCTLFYLHLTTVQGNHLLYIMNCGKIEGLDKTMSSKQKKEFQITKVRYTNMYKN